MDLGAIDLVSAVNLLNKRVIVFYLSYYRKLKEIEFVVVVVVVVVVVHCFGS
jgi:hypothetical protein